MIPLPLPRPGDPIEARPFRRAFERINNWRRVSVPPGVTLSESSAGISVHVRREVIVEARLVTDGGFGSYLVQPLRGNADGTWHDDVWGPVTAYEYNLSTGLAAGTVVRMKRESTTGTWRFQRNTC